MEAHSALGRAARDVVPDTVTREDLARSVVELHRKADGHFALRKTQHLANGSTEVQLVSGAIVLLECDLPGRVHSRGGNVGHRGRLPLLVEAQRMLSNG